MIRRFLKHGERLKLLKSGRMRTLDKLLRPLEDKFGRRTVKMIKSGRRRALDQGGLRPTKSPSPIHIKQNSSPDSLQKLGVHEYAGYYKRHVLVPYRHVLTFKCFTGPKLFFWLLTHNLWFIINRDLLPEIFPCCWINITIESSNQPQSINHKKQNHIFETKIRKIWIRRVHISLWWKWH